MGKIRVYINSVAPVAVDYIDMKSIEHPCSKAGERAFEGMKNLRTRSSGFLSDEERKAIEIVEQFCREKALEYEIVDLAYARATTQLKFILKRWKVPVTSSGSKIIKGLPTRQQLESLLP